MDNWPLYRERYAPQIFSDVPPEFRDGLTLLLLIFLTIGAFLYALYRRRGKNSSGTSSIVLGSYAMLQTFFTIGIVLALYSTESAGELFWVKVGYGTMAGTGYFVVNTLLYTLLWFAFGESGNVLTWFRNYFILWGITGCALYLPIFTALTGVASERLILTMSAVIYLGFRIALIGQSFRVFPKLLKYPMHIILYLCTLEVAPLLFLLV